MKIALIGYGKMGKAIEEIALSRGHVIVLKIASENIAELTEEKLKEADVAIEFSRPDGVINNITLAAKSKTPIVVGTTAWYDNYDEMTELVKSHNSTMLAATNFSIGVNLFFELNERLAKLMNNHKDYSASIDETHHTQKLDSPSGTAITLAEGIVKNHDHYTFWKEQYKEENQVLNIRSHRLEDVPGTHRISYDSEIDSISIEHKAHNRKGFALGALIAAEFIHNKIGIYTMKDVINL